MAPEVLDKEKHKKAADVFSLSVILIECFKWGEAYQNTVFKCRWQISSFVQRGKHAEKLYEMRTWLLSSKFWKAGAGGSFRPERSVVLVLNESLLFFQLKMMCVTVDLRGTICPFFLFEQIRRDSEPRCHFYRFVLN